MSGLGLGLRVNALRSGAADPISILGDKLAAWYTSDPSTLFTTSTGETPVTAAGEPVGLRVNRVSGGPDASQATAPARPTYQVTPSRLVYDASDDALDITLPAISGGQIVISSPVGIWIDSLEFAGGTFSLGPDTYTGGPAALLPLLDNTEKEILILPTAMTPEEQAKVVAYYEARGSAGLITLGSELWPQPAFDASTGLTLDANWSIGSGVAWSNGSNGFMRTTDNVLSTGKKYLTSIDVVTATSGQVYDPYDGAGSNISARSTAGTYSRIFQAAGNLPIRTNSQSFNGTIDNVSCREIIMP